jgi:enoyl-CoA hydratase/carnithine racemase
MGEVTWQRDGHVARIVISDPERHNAMSVGMWQSLHDAVQAIDADPKVRVALLRGEGERAFVSGANIGEFATARSSDEAVASYNALVARTQAAIQNARVPVIALIAGYCYGGGLGIALSCDLRYASPSARFRMPAARMGLGYAVDGIRSFIQQLGPQAAAEAFFTARVYDAQAAVGLGIVRAVADDVFAHGEALAAEIAANAPLTVQATKQAMRAVLADEQDLASVDAAVDACFRSRDYLEGRTAFAEKRSPRFEGR